MSSDDEPKPPAAWFRYADAASLGIEIAVSVSLCAFVGRYVEQNFTHWSPWTTLIAIGIGIGAATRAIVRTARNYKRQLAADAAKEAAEEAAASNPRGPTHDA